MEIKSPTQNVPLFHCVDRDWRSEGFKLQYAPSLEEEAETAINTLLPLLKHMFPEVDVADHFEAFTEQRCQYMEWNKEKKMIIDTLAPDETENIEEEENLVGFVFDFGKTGIRRPDRTESTQNLPIPNFPPHDDDSISTLHPLDRTTLTTATHTQSSQS